MRKKVFRILCIIFSAGVFMSVFYPWTVLNGESYTIDYSGRSAHAPKCVQRMGIAV